ncbi:MAG: hypothetical protein RL094_106 [Candidatus Parcubacteria bacterium]|jgi:dephospho-CoA kinase
MIIIGLTGTIGAGKGTVVDYLTKEKGFVHYSAREVLTREVEKRGMPLNRDSYAHVANGLRNVHGPFYIAEQLFIEAKKHGRNAIIESLRTPGEVNFLRENPGFVLLAVDADIETRYERIKRRKSETDHISFEKFKSDNEREMTSVDPYSQNINACIAMADAVVHNQGSLEALYVEVDEALAKFFK